MLRPLRAYTLTLPSAAQAAIATSFLFVSIAAAESTPIPTGPKFDQRFGEIAASALVEIARSSVIHDIVLQDSITKDPSSPADSEQFLACVVGSDSVTRALQHLPPSTMVRGKKLTVRAVQPSELRTDLAALTGCRLAYLGKDTEARLSGVHTFAATKGDLVVRDLPTRTEKLPILFVTASPLVYRKIGGIWLLNEANRLRIRVNLPSVKERGIMLSSDLLELATLDTEPSSAGS
jgi:hypothetical protein